MGHAHHFLSRLDRVSLPHVELALSLYRDEPLLRYILHRAKIPELTPRVALSLDHPKDGPFLIVTRDGKFVTCLSEGMSIGPELPVITRVQLDGFTTRVQNVREGIAAATEFAGNRGVSALLRRIYDAADELSREEFIALSALQPLYGHEFLRLSVNAAIDLFDAQETLIPVLRKTNKPSSHYNDLLRIYWNTLWAMGNLAMLASVDGAARLDPAVLQFMEQGVLTRMTTHQGLVSIALRGIWAAAKLGKPLLASYKQRLRDANTQLENIDAVAALMAIGARHTRLRAEVQKSINVEVVDSIKGTPRGNASAALRDYAEKIMELDGKIPGFSEKSIHQHGGEIAVILCKHKALRGFQFKSPQEVPEDLAHLLTINGNWCYLDHATNAADHLLLFVVLAPLIGRCSPEKLYYPADIIRSLSVPWTPESPLRVLRQMRDHIYRPGGYRRPDGPTRKGPCPCGSGKKYKRCCGEGKDDAED